MPLHFKTALSQVNDGEETVRGHGLHDLVKSKTFVEVMYLLLRGELPTPAATKMLNAMLAMMIDHGPVVSSAMTARIVSSAGNELHTSVAAGILALGGTRHGGALGGAAAFFQEHLSNTDLEATVKKLKEQKIRIPGYGHRVLVHDNRTDTLFDIANETGFFGAHCKLALSVGNALNTVSSKPIPLNMDGANAAILLDMGFDAKLATGFFLIGRMPGLVAQVYEEMNDNVGLRRLDEDEIEYVGK